MRETLIAGNWKLNGSKHSINELVDGIIQGADAVNCAVALCAPFVYVPMVSEMLGNRLPVLGAQDVSEHESGAYTGEVSATMLAEFNCRYCLVGHSERRYYHSESDEQVAEKFNALQNAGIRPILCVGETLEDREQGTTRTVVDAQVNAVINKVGIQAFADAVIAYEPVWAIGTGKTATPEQAQAVHADIRQLLGQQDDNIAADVQILYGGSMNAANAASLLSMPDIDGGLIGGASLKADDFLTICQAA